MRYGCEKDEGVKAGFVSGIENGKPDEEVNEGNHGDNLIAGSGEAKCIVDYISHGQSSGNIDDCRLLRP